MQNDYAHACRNLIGSDTYKSALEIVQSRAVEAILAAKNPEDRESKYQEYAALKRVNVFLHSKASEITEKG